MKKLKQLSVIPFALLIGCTASQSVMNEELPQTKQSTSAKGDSVQMTEADKLEKKSKASEPETRNTERSDGKTHASSNAKVPGAWELSGVMAARNNKKSWTAQINWIQYGESSYQIRLFGPLGSGTIIIERKGSNVTYRDGPKSIASQNADELLYQQTGVRLPVKDLYYWVRGIPAPYGVSSEKRNEAHQLMLLKQAGYTIEYPKYQQAGSSVLPGVIKLQGHGVAVKLVVKRWKA